MHQLCNSYTEFRADKFIIELKCKTWENWVPSLVPVSSTRTIVNSLGMLVKQFIIYINVCNYTAFTFVIPVPYLFTIFNLSLYFSTWSHTRYFQYETTVPRPPYSSHIETYLVLRKNNELQSYNRMGYSFKLTFSSASLHLIHKFW